MARDVRSYRAFLNNGTVRTFASDYRKGSEGNRKDMNNQLGEDAKKVVRVVLDTTEDKLWTWQSSIIG